MGARSWVTAILVRGGEDKGNRPSGWADPILVPTWTLQIDGTDGPVRQAGATASMLRLARLRTLPDDTPNSVAVAVVQAVQVEHGLAIDAIDCQRLAVLGL